MDKSIKQRLNTLNQEEKNLVAKFSYKYGDLLKEVMEERGFNELLLAPLDCDGDIMEADYYMYSCGEWNLDWEIDKNARITRFGIIDGSLCYHATSQDGWIANTENREEPWHCVSEFPKLEKLKKIVKACLSDDFFWKFTENHPGSRFLPFDFNLDGYIGRRGEIAELYQAFSGLSQIETLDLKAIASEDELGIYHAFANCSSLKSIDLSGFNIENFDYGDAFTGCTSLETITMLGCNESSVTAIKNALIEAELPQSVTIITDEEPISVKR